jgi:hypothetical protein
MDWSSCAAKGSPVQSHLKISLLNSFKRKQYQHRTDVSADFSWPLGSPRVAL